ncbi:MAG: SDR family NAD(P)-dependent oxidoreductase [Lachnospiraceae bacterium]|nr:SDR family NAD(P)-dependent oxidoreductase [Lachnospiraceae bacterium]MBQ9936439.1 SDR family NAD(P)-dependent oxidoreductase [Lachnospiraceae bacterium]
MAQNVMITGTGRSYALGYNMVLRYLENGDNVIATVRKESPELNELKETYGDKLFIVNMDIGSTESVNAAKKQVEKHFEHIDLLINNAVSVSPDCDKEFFDANLDYIARTVDITAVGPLRVIKAFYPLLAKSMQTALVINITSEAGSIGRCYRTNLIDYGMAKAALNMGTMNLVNVFKDDEKINIFCVHPGWIRTDGKEDNPAPLSSYEAAEILRKLFEEKRNDKTGPRFITNEGVEYPF